MTYEDDDQEYFYHRAEAEIEAAQRSTSAPAVKAHVELAERYLEKCVDYQPEGDEE
ncbi:hypothetical protein SAMN05192583_2560 [Sphingomonas gellani]|uniref:Uncharacterized protein n=1 Tax=Sphingomonas gellani TaxID=1166340 RepID=A0A1H8FSZ9_9SPHN|nr:hypothetical protein [Sphingomonas gellani]SEN34863.1 hypothetical protein SAMN05192583_2560 [Sphingomonas gellani]